MGKDSMVDLLDSNIPHLRRSHFILALKPRATALRRPGATDISHRWCFRYQWYLV